MYLNPASDADDAEEVSAKTNPYISSAKDGIFSKWKFEFNCQFISIRYGETRPPSVSVKLVPISPFKTDSVENSVEEVGVDEVAGVLEGPVDITV